MTNEQVIENVEWCKRLVRPKSKAFKALDIAIDALKAQRTGTWERRVVEDDSPLFRVRFYCSSCGEWNTYGESEYCPNCGSHNGTKDAISD